MTATRKRSRRGALKSIGRYLRGVTSEHYRGLVRAVFRRLCQAQGFGWPSGALTDKHREALADALFQILDELESREGGASEVESAIEAVEQMRVARGLVERDLGWTDAPGTATRPAPTRQPAELRDPHRTGESTGGAGE